MSLTEKLKRLGQRMLGLPNMFDNDELAAIYEAIDTLNGPPSAIQPNEGFVCADGCGRPDPHTHSLDVHGLIHTKAIKDNTDERMRLSAIAGAEAQQRFRRQQSELARDAYAAAPVAQEAVKPLCWVRTLNGEVDWSEDCLQHDNDLADYNAEDGYAMVALVPQRNTVPPEETRISERSKAIREHDYPVYQNFWSKYAMPSKLPPSCLVCGQAQPERETWGIQHAELPNIIVCVACRDARHMNGGTIPK